MLREKDIVCTDNSDISVTTRYERDCANTEVITFDLKRESIYLAGRYCKYNRYLSQTPWLTFTSKSNEISESPSYVLPISLEEIIKQAFATCLERYFPLKTKFFDTIIFSASGREDVNVRCLGDGRPFCLEIKNSRLSPEQLFAFEGNLAKDMSFLVSDFTVVTNQKFGHSYKYSLDDSYKIDNSIITSKMHLNYGDSKTSTSWSNLISIKDIQFVSKKSVKTFVKLGEQSKAKTYIALCFGQNAPIFPDPYNSLSWNDRFMNSLDKYKVSPDNLSAISDPQNMPKWILDQKTPLRVLHRRTQSTRKKEIYDITVRFLDPHYFILHITCQAGTYVKEFVHGDFGRTQPNLSNILGQPICLLELDVTEIHLDWPPKKIIENGDTL